MSIFEIMIMIILSPIVLIAGIFSIAIIICVLMTIFEAIEDFVDKK